MGNTFQAIWGWLAANQPALAGAAAVVAILGGLIAMLTNWKKLCEKKEANQEELVDLKPATRRGVRRRFGLIAIAILLVAFTAAAAWVATNRQPTGEGTAELGDEFSVLGQTFRRPASGSLFVQQTTITQAGFRKFNPTYKAHFNPEWPDWKPGEEATVPDLPAETITARQALAYCDWFTQLSEVRALGLIARLPTTAELRTLWGDADLSRLDLRVNTGTKWRPTHDRPAPVHRAGAPATNGFVEVYGNVAAICVDGNTPYRFGWSFNDPVAELAPQPLGWDKPRFDVGFRVVLVPGT